jgi:hypothetical protein
MSTDRDRQRLRRARQRAGRIPVTVEIDEVDWAEELIEAGFLAPHEAEDRKAIGDALSRFLDVLRHTDVNDLVSRCDR